jgi:hypothetical protein
MVEGEDERLQGQVSDKLAAELPGEAEQIQACASLSAVVGSLPSR